MRWLLLALLAAGPLQAQTVMLCEMLGLPQQDTCCCHEPEPARNCDDAENHLPLRGADHDCCAEVVELSFAPETHSDAAKPSVPRGDPELPQAAAIVQVLPEPAAPHVARIDHGFVDTITADGSHIYLLTERLRI